MSHFTNCAASNKEQILNNFFSIDFTSPTGTPITLDEAKTHLNVTFTDNDTYLTSLIEQCIAAVENETNTSIKEKTVTVLADIVSEFELPYGPVKEFTSVSTKQNGVFAISDANNYTIDTDIQFARYAPGPSGRIKMIYTAGYGEDMPYPLKLSILNEIAFRYENKGDSVNRYAAQNVGISEGAQALAAPYRRLQWL